MNEVSLFMHIFFLRFTRFEIRLLKKTDQKLCVYLVIFLLSLFYFYGKCDKKKTNPVNINNVFVGK